MKTRWERWRVIAVCAVLGGCGSIVDMSGNSSVNPRRLFVNDVAVNDSLRNAMLNRGVFFVMQPDKEYNLRIRTPDPDSRLSLYVENGTTYSRVEDGIEGVVTGGDTLTFALQSLRDNGFAQHLVFLRAPDGTPAQRPTQVRLLPAGSPPEQSSAVSVKLIVAGQIEMLPTATEKETYIREFLEEVVAIFDAYGIAIDTMSQIAEAGAPPINYDFFSNEALPGTRTPGAIHMYLVNNISADEGDVPQQILGFAPREALDLDLHPTSRILLSAAGGSAVNVATTAAHELGHFLGLRHTSSTEMDLQQDRDQTNRHDGFSSTDSCDVHGVLSRSASPAHIEAIGPEGTMYCLRVAASCPPVNVCPAVTNLMFPFACGAPESQRELTGQQQTFLRENLWLYQ